MAHIETGSETFSRTYGHLSQTLIWKRCQSSHRVPVEVTRFPLCQYRSQFIKGQGALYSSIDLLLVTSWWLSGKESACNTGDTGEVGLTPGSGRSPRGGNGNPFQYSCLESTLEREAWQGAGFETMGFQKVGHD